MSNWQLTTPVAFLIFNRPDTTGRVFQEIRKARPPKLFLIADGPRRDRIQEPRLCAETRAIVQAVDWACEVRTNFSDINLGCRERVASGLDWLFSHADEAIILEDDCLPHESFFRYCADLLEQYRSDHRIGMITGTNLQAGRKRGDASYYFSKYPCVWGWASWRRVWSQYDRTASIWPEFLRSGALDAVTTPSERIYWERAFEGVYRRTIDTWDYQFALSCWSQSMVTIIPNSNLISNIGFGPDATHTKDGDSALAQLTTRPLQFPLTHPRLVVADRAADDFVAARAFNERFRSKVRRCLGLSRPRPRVVHELEGGLAAKNP